MQQNIKSCFATVKPFQECFVVAAKRTPVGKFLGKLARFRAPDLAGFAIQRSINDIHLDPEYIDEVLMGVALQSGIGQNPARQAALLGGVNIETPATTIGKVCASGLKSVLLGSASIWTGNNKCVVAGGFERRQFGDTKTGVVDGIMVDGIVDKYSDQPMGLIAEQFARDSDFSKDTLDAVTIASYERLLLAKQSGFLKNQIVPIQIHDSKGNVLSFFDDGYLEEYDQEKILNDVGFYTNGGVITEKNQSQFGDGGAALILVNGQLLKELGLTPLARIVAFKEVEKEPFDYALASVEAVNQLLKKTKIPKEKIDIFEIGEDFPSTLLAHLIKLNIDFDKVNPFGGSLALGNPLGMTGARMMVNIVYGLKQLKGKYGVVAMGNGGGGGTAVLVESL